MCQNMKRTGVGGMHSQTGEHKGMVKSEHEKNLSEFETLTN
jgi:hypothetical protein